ncbi:DUF4138 domain-containing protein [Algoriphagus terrigena]|uniref:DUF4138 domain-containing protein n=1 Tax=Algoriphagus terrigena TaxID=344884 RepID=UPI0004797925|nr:DUF4138 domain-containing protein [Algoriphagus terrigena]
MRIALTLIAIVLSQLSHAQLIPEPRMPAYSISIGWDKTTVLVFPFEVVSADLGSASILAQKDPAAPNLLRLKAGKRDFVPTNLYVVTADEQLYPFEVSYSPDPDPRPIDMGLQRDYESAKAQLEGVSLNRHEMEMILDELSERTLQKANWGKKRGGVRIGIGEVYEKGGVLFLPIKIENSSQMDYVPRSWDFTIRDKKVLKRTTIRNVPVIPLALPEMDGVSGKSALIQVVALPRFTLSESKEFHIRLIEKNGDRNPDLSVSGKKFLRPRSIAISTLN